MEHLSEVLPLLSSPPPRSSPTSSSPFFRVRELEGVVQDDAQGPGALRQARADHDPRQLPPRQGGRPLSFFKGGVLGAGLRRPLRGLHSGADLSLY